MKNKGLGLTLLAVLAVVVIATIVVASQPCEDLSDCGQAAEDFCEQIEGSTANGSRIIIQVDGSSTCEMCCANGTCRTLQCFGPSQ